METILGVCSGVPERSQMKSYNVMIGQSGGPTAVINQSLWGAVSVFLDGVKVKGVLGARHGVDGVLKGDIVDLRATGRRRWKSVARTPGAALGSVRHKPGPDECVQLVERLVSWDVRHFCYIGGNDSAETAHLMNEAARAAGRDLRVWHIPKTIDNDLRASDHCPGYPSAARFVACAFLGDEEDNRSLAGVKLNVVMGRDAGWLTAASVLARRHDDAGPHLVYVPERAFSLDGFVADVEAVVKRLGRCVVAVSEGVRDAQGRPIGASGEKDSHGNLQLSGSGFLGDHLAATLKSRLGLKRVRADTLGYLQRGFAGCVSTVDAQEAFEAGATAAHAALKEKRDGGSVAIVRRPGKKRYASECKLVELTQVAKVTRPLELRFLAGGNDIDPSFAEWLAPLVGELPETERLLHKSWTHAAARPLPSKA